METPRLERQIYCSRSPTGRVERRDREQLRGTGEDGRDGTREEPERTREPRRDKDTELRQERDVVGPDMCPRDSCAAVLTQDSRRGWIWRSAL
jgi:hypothetical protein